jgi:CheY-like chemotaxis protein
VASRLGHGSTFRVTLDPGTIDGGRFILPLPQHDGSPQEAVLHDASPKTLPCRLLLAEDALDTQRLISVILRKAGVEVTCVDNGQSALEAALGAQRAGSPFEVILMDMQMPVLDGYEATRQLRQAGYRWPIVALTAHAMSGEREKCLDAGCDGYATKPINREALLQMVARYVQPPVPERIATS